MLTPGVCFPSAIAWGARLLKRSRSSFPVSLDGQLVMNSRAVLNQETRDLMVTCNGSPVHERGIVRPSNVRFRHGDAGRVCGPGLEHCLERVESPHVYGFMQNVVRGIVYLERSAAVKKDLYGRTASLHADDDMEQVLANAVYHCRFLRDDVSHVLDVRRAAPSLRFRPHRRSDEFLLRRREFGYLLAANEPVPRKEPHSLIVAHSLPP